MKPNQSHTHSKTLIDSPKQLTLLANQQVHMPTQTELFLDLYDEVKFESDVKNR